MTNISGKIQIKSKRQGDLINHYRWSRKCLWWWWLEKDFTENFE